MKILHINSYFSTSKFYKNLFNHQVLNELDIEVYIPVTNDFNSQGFEYGSYSTISKTNGRYDRYFFYYKHYKILKDISVCYEIKSFDLIHAHSLFSNGFIAWKLKKMFGIPYIVAVRNTDVNVFFKRMIHLRKIGINILRDADKIIFISEPYQKLVLEKYIPLRYRKNFYNKSYVITNGIDDFWFENRRSVPKTLNTNLIKLLFVGAINTNKNVTTTIKAIDKLRTKGYNIQFNIVGKIENQKIFNDIRSKPYVNYYGEKAKEELLKTYNFNDIFVMPSINETFGLVYAEAMSQGLPIIYSKNQGFDGQFNDGIVGYRVDSLDPNEISNKVIDIINNYNTISRSCIKYSENFKWDAIVKNYTYLYSNIILEGRL